MDGSDVNTSTDNETRNNNVICSSDMAITAQDQNLEETWMNNSSTTNSQVPNAQNSQASSNSSGHDPVVPPNPGIAANSSHTHAGYTLLPTASNENSNPSTTDTLVIQTNEIELESLVEPSTEERDTPTPANLTPSGVSQSTECVTAELSNFSMEELSLVLKAVEKAMDQHALRERGNCRDLRRKIEFSCMKLQCIEAEHCAIRDEFHRDVIIDDALNREKTDAGNQLQATFDQELLTFDPVLKASFPYLHNMFHNCNTGKAIAELHHMVAHKCSVLRRLTGLIKIKEYKITRNKKEKIEFKKAVRELNKTDREAAESSASAGAGPATTRGRKLKRTKRRKCPNSPDRPTIRPSRGIEDEPEPEWQDFQETSLNIVEGRNSDPALETEL